MQIQDIRLLFDYNYWATGKLVSAASRLSAEQFAAPADFPFGGVRGTLVHVLDAEESWRKRLQQRPIAATELPETAFATLAALVDRWREEEREMHAYFGGLDDAAVAATVRYPLDDGTMRSRIIWHCLVHVVNHGTQHRAEAAASLTTLGQSPGELDFTDFLLGRP